MEAAMPVVNMKIVVGVRDSVGGVYVGPHRPGKTFISSERLVLEGIDDNTAGLPPEEEDRQGLRSSPSRAGRTTTPRVVDSSPRTARIVFST
jgi:hypothetical protein